MKTSPGHSIPILLGILIPLLAGCERPASPHAMDTELSRWIGETVRVQFRRDALGAAATLPIGPRTSSMNGAETTLVGKLLAVHPSSLVITESDREQWIPREVVLYVQGPLRK